MKDNVFITVRERGKIAARRSGHNVWLDAGRAFLAQMLSYSSFSPVTPERSDRIRYATVGIGGSQQNDPDADTAPWTTYYPAGSDPQNSDGHSYKKDYPIEPLITTLERPVKWRGIVSDYAGSLLGDEWPVVNTFMTHSSLSSVSVHAVLDGPGADILLPPFTTMPLSEIGLLTSSADLLNPFNPILAYYSFDTIQMNADTVIEAVWQVRF